MSNKESCIITDLSLKSEKSVTDGVLLSLKNIFITASKANFSSFILTNSQVRTIKDENAGSLIVNNPILIYNVLANVSTIYNTITFN